MNRRPDREVVYRAVSPAGLAAPSDDAAEDELIAAALALPDVLDEVEALSVGFDVGAEGGARGVLLQVQLGRRRKLRQHEKPLRHCMNDEREGVARGHEELIRRGSQPPGGQA